MSAGLYKNEIVWIVGASSGIGSALASELARRGAACALSARRKEALQKLKKELGVDHKIYPLDVTDSDSILAAAAKIKKDFGRIDRVVFLAAGYAPMKLDRLDLKTTKQIVDINLLGALYTIDSALPILKKQSKGQIALCASIAGYIGLAGGQPYSATKAGVINLAESLHAESPEHIDVKVINPGFVRTALTDKNDFKMPMIITPDRAAKYIADGLLSSCFEVHFPKSFTFGLKLLNILPYRLALFLAKKISS